MVVRGGDGGGGRERRRGRGEAGWSRFEGNSVQLGQVILQLKQVDWRRAKSPSKCDF